MPEGSIGLSGGEKVIARLTEISDQISKAATLRVGFLENSTYATDTESPGTSVPMVAFIQEYGAPAAGIPARPYFRNMIAAHQSEWGPMIAALLKANGYDSARALTAIGKEIAEELQQSIRNTNDPPLSPITLMLRKMKAKNPHLVIGGKIVAEAAARVAAGESTDGVSTKPLIESATMINAVNFEVTE